MHVQKPEQSSCSLLRPGKLWGKRWQSGLCCSCECIQPTASCKYQTSWDLLWIHNIDDTNWKFLLYCMYTTRHLLLAKKSLQEIRSAGQGFWFWGLRQSTPESKVCGYKIMAEHSLPLRLYSQCQLLQQKDNKGVLWVVIFCRFYYVKQFLERELFWAADLLLLHCDTTLNSNLLRFQHIWQNLLTLKDCTFSTCNLFSFMLDIL